MSEQLVVIGLGYVGLPLTQEATRAGLGVVGLDTSARVVDLRGHVMHCSALMPGGIELFDEARFITADWDSHKLHWRAPGAGKAAGQG